MSERFLRPSGANLAFRYVVGGFLLLILGAVLMEDGLGHPADLILVVIWGPRAWVVARTHKLGVTLGDDHAVVHRDGWSHRFERSDVRGAVVQHGGDLLGRRDLYIEMTTGLKSTPLITFSNRARLEAQAATIIDWANADPSA